MTATTTSTRRVVPLEERNCLGQAIRDQNNVVDAAYWAVVVLTIAAVASLVFVLTLDGMAFFLCRPLQHECVYDPRNAGIAIGAIFAAYSALLGALAGYMAATRRRD